MRTTQPLLRRPNRLVFFYIFRDFDKGTFDAGLEFTTLVSVTRGNILCKSITANIKGWRHDSFLVSQRSRRILNLRGRYIVYWTSGRRGSEMIYNRRYRTRDGRIYHHASRDSQSQLTYDDEGFEKAAENSISHPRRYYEKFVRLFRF